MEGVWNLGRKAVRERGKMYKEREKRKEVGNEAQISFLDQVTLFRSFYC